MFSLYIHVVPSTQRLPLALSTAHPSKVWPTWLQVFAALVNDAPFITVELAGGTPVASVPHAYVTLYRSPKYAYNVVGSTATCKLSESILPSALMTWVPVAFSPVKNPPNPLPVLVGNVVNWVIVVVPAESLYHPVLYFKYTVVGDPDVVAPVVFNVISIGVVVTHETLPSQV